MVPEEKAGASSILSVNGYDPVGPNRPTGYNHD